MAQLATQKLYGDGDRQRLLPISTGAARSSWRSPFRKDFGRLLHCPAFRRLQGKTQLFTGLESDFFRNRLTHSLEVAQIAKSIAVKLNHENPDLEDIDLDLVEFSGLAHDLGHPPFGHTGEHVLNALMACHGGFEGNAQTLRILSRLEKKLDNPDIQYLDDSSNPVWFREGREASFGLNLCCRSLAAVLKYDSEITLQRHVEQVRKGYYHSEIPIIDEIRKNVAPGISPLKVLECQIMDIADDIAYSTYDIEDAFKAGFITPLEILHPPVALLNSVTDGVRKKLGRSEFTAKDTSSVINRVFADFDDVEFGVRVLVSKLFASDGFYRNWFTSKIVNHYVDGVRIEINNGTPSLSKVYLVQDVEEEVEVMKRLTYETMIMSNRLKVVERKADYILKTIFEALSTKNGWEMLPDDYRQMYEQALENSDKGLPHSDANGMRVICDFIAGMTDRYAVEFFCRLRSENHQTIFRTI